MAHCSLLIISSIGVSLNGGLNSKSVVPCSSNLIFAISGNETIYSTTTGSAIQPNSMSTTPLNPNDLPILHPNGKNYLQWAQVIRTTLKGCWKLSYIEGNPPKRDDSQFESWDDEDSLIMTWLWNCVAPEISRNYMFLPPTRKI